jgi:hypothetical protein
VKTFRSLVVLKRPRQELWTVMRDHLVEFSGQITDIESVRQIERTVDAECVVHIVNEWRVRQQVPAVLRPILKTSELVWIDRNSWDERTYTCSWTIEPEFLTKYISCSGQTSLAEAMAGQGTRVTFEGGLDLKPGLLGSAMGGIENLASGFLESIITTVIPRNLRSVIEAAAAFVPRQDGA